MRNRVRLAFSGRGELCGGELEALDDRIGMFEQDLPLGRQPQAAGAPVEQPGTDLAFELSHLV